MILIDNTKGLIQLSITVRLTSPSIHQLSALRINALSTSLLPSALDAHSIRENKSNASIHSLLRHPRELDWAKHDDVGTFVMKTV